MIRFVASGSILFGLLVSVTAAAGEFEGLVVDQNGKPVANAVVAGNPWKQQLTADGQVIRHISRSDGKGRFHLRDLPAGSYGATATSPDRGSAFLGNLSIPETGALENQVLQLSGPAIVLEGSLRTAGGSLPEGTVVGAMRQSEVEGDLFYGELHGGHYRFSLAPGRYMLAARAPGWASLPANKTLTEKESVLRIDFKLIPQYGSDPALAKEIIDMGAADQKARFAWIQSKDEAHEKETAQVDAGNQARVQEILKQYGWPGADLIGYQADDSLWLLVQHESPEMIKRWLPGMKAAAERGDLPWANVALSIDRDLMNDNKKQRYGSQVQSDDGIVVLYPVEDEAHLDERRAKIDLPPIAEYKATLLKLYHPDGAK